MEGKAIEGEKVEQYLKDLSGILKRQIFKGLNKKELNEETEDLVYTYSVIQEIQKEMKRVNPGKGILMDDFKNLISTLESKLAPLVSNA